VLTFFEVWSRSGGGWTEIGARAPNSGLADTLEAGGDGFPQRLGDAQVSQVEELSGAGGAAGGGGGARLLDASPAPVLMIQPQPQADERERQTDAGQHENEIFRHRFS
jgi:hypothetical protein